MKQGKLEAQKDKLPPLVEIDFDQKTLTLELRFEIADAESKRIEKSIKGII